MILLRVASVRDLWGLLVEAGTRWVDDQCLRLGAALSYYAIFSLFPLALLSVTILGFALGDDPSVRAGIVGSMDATGSPAVHALLDETLVNMQQHHTARGVGAVIGIITLFFGASGVFSELDNALNLIWRVRATPSTGIWRSILWLVRDKAISFLLVIVASVLVLASLVASTVLAALGRSAESIVPAAWLWGPLEFVVSGALLAVVLGTMFRLIPRAPVAWSDVYWGAVLTATLFSIVRKLFAYYLAHVGSYAAYGAAGAVLGLLTWIYVTSLILFFGAEFTRVYAERFGSRAKLAKPPVG